jgi:hypothetical protein
VQGDAPIIERMSISEGAHPWKDFDKIFPISQLTGILSITIRTIGL